MSKVYLMLDIDGVINAEQKVPYENFKKVKIKTPDLMYAPYNGWVIKYDPKVVDFINELPENVELKWTTSWAGHAVSHFAPYVGITRPAKVSFIEAGLGYDERFQIAPDEMLLLKLNAVRSVPFRNSTGEYDEVSKVLWIDDMLSTHLINIARDELEDRGIAFKAIVPSSKTGLRDKEIQEILDFISEP